MSLTFSIIIPVYNVAPYLRECLDSVLAQTFVDWEAICVDDGSTDESGAILDEYAAKDKRFRVIHQANGGVARARNAALDVATGEWIQFVDGDDVLAVDALSLVASALGTAGDVDLVRIKSLVFADGNVCSFAKPDASKFSVCEFESGVLWQDLAFAAGCEYLYRREFVGYERFRDFVVGEDGLFAMTSLLKAQKLLRTEFAVYGYRQRSGSAMHATINQRKHGDDLLWQVSFLCQAENAARVVDKDWIARMCRKITAYYVPTLHRFNLDDRTYLFGLWCDQLDALAKLRKVPTFYRVLFRFCRVFRWYFFAVALTLLPRLLRRFNLCA